MNADAFVVTAGFVIATCHLTPLLTAAAGLDLSRIDTAVTRGMDRVLDALFTDQAGTR